MKYDAHEIEERWKAFWETEKVFSFDAASKAPLYVVDTPPPYVSADHLHAGHIMSYAQGGGVDHGETIESTLVREVEEELGVQAEEVSCDFQIVHNTIGAIVNGVPRMNLYFKAALPEASLKKTDHVTEWKWFARDEFLKSEMNPSYNKEELANVIFGES